MLTHIPSPAQLKGPLSWPPPASCLPAARWVLPLGGCDTKRPSEARRQHAEAEGGESGPRDANVKPEAQGRAAVAMVTQLWAGQKPTGPRTDPGPPQAPSPCLPTLPTAETSRAPLRHPASKSPGIRVTWGRPGQHRGNADSSRCFPDPSEVSDPAAGRGLLLPSRRCPGSSRRWRGGSGDQACVPGTSPSPTPTGAVGALSEQTHKGGPWGGHLGGHPAGHLQP